MRLIVIGSPSVDLLHFRGRSERSAGGAGLYTGLAAQRAGAEVTVIAPRAAPMPPELEASAAVLDWRGPEIDPSGLPHFEIEYLPDGETVYHKGVQGSEGEIEFDHLPPLESGWFTYVVPLLDPARQLAFARHLKQAGLRVACGAYRGGILRHREAVDRVLETSDYFFCNEREAELLFGSVDKARVDPGHVLFVTRGERGARVVLGDHHADVAPVSVDELDPTGAGDTFCGTVLARIALGDHPLIAARHASAAAAEMVTAVGPTRLLDPTPLPGPRRDPRVVVEPERIARVAELISTAPEAAAFDFTGSAYPPEGDPVALDFFFTGTAQQFGFWSTADGRYEAPMIASIDGVDLKGSDYLWAAYRRWSIEAPDELAPSGHAGLTDAEFNRRLRADHGRNPLPAGALHPDTARAYGRDMVALGLTPLGLLEVANESERPLATFLQTLDGIGGYKEDPWQKKSALLAAILMQRPERFLQPAPDEDVPAIVDYHCLRSCLRLGLVTVADDDLRGRLAHREVVSASDEEAVRAACSEAVTEVWRLSGRPMGAVDWFFFQNRSRCPEMTEPDCAACPADAVCAHLKDLFQPVFRTTAY